MVDHEAIMTRIRAPKYIAVGKINVKPRFPTSLLNFLNLRYPKSYGKPLCFSASQEHAADVERSSAPHRTCNARGSGRGALKVMTPIPTYCSEIDGGSLSNVTDIYCSVNEKLLSRLAAIFNEVLVYFRIWSELHRNLGCFHGLKVTQLFLCGKGGLSGPIRLTGSYPRIYSGSEKGRPSRSFYRILYAAVRILVCGGVSYRLIIKSDFSPNFRWDISLLFLAFIMGALGFCMLLDSLFDVIQDLNNASGSLIAGAVSHGNTLAN